MDLGFRARVRWGYGLMTNSDGSSGGVTSRLQACQGNRDAMPCCPGEHGRHKNSPTNTGHPHLYATPSYVDQLADCVPLTSRPQIQSGQQTGSLRSWCTPHSTVQLSGCRSASGCHSLRDSGWQHATLVDGQPACIHGSSGVPNSD
jgi:hypothetical protein